MKNIKWMTLFLVTKSILTTSAFAEYYPSIEPANNTALPWWSERTNLPPTIEPYQQALPIAPAQPSHRRLHPQVRVQPANFKKTPALTLRNALNCQSFNAKNLPDRCIQKTNSNRRGLKEQVKFLKRLNPNMRVAGKWANISNAALLQTAKELLSWESRYTPHSFQERFSLREIGSHKNSGNADYTGYFTPVLQVQNHPDQQYRFPIYAPPRNGTRLSRKQINQGALRKQGLEIAWTNDRVNLFFAHIQGSAIARYPNGVERYLGYSASNNHSYGKISTILRAKRYIQGSLSNTSIRSWLHANPHKMDEVLHKNPRYIFFSMSDKQPRTTTGSTVIPGHTVAVDDHYIPLGAVLLAEVPRIDHTGRRVGNDWRLLFAQDRGDAIKGPGRLDIYMGMGDRAEQTTYPVTGLHRTYMLVRKPGFFGKNVAGL